MHQQNDTRSVWLRRCLVLFMLSMHAALLAYQGAGNSPTLDEIGHLPAGVRHWTARDFHLYRVNPPLVRMVAAIPVLFVDVEFDWTLDDAQDPYSRAEFVIGQHFVRDYGMKALRCFTLARWVCIPISLLGALYTLRWASDMWGKRSGLLAFALWCFSPNILAHASLITPDLGAATFVVVASYYFWRWWKTKSMWSVLAAGTGLGLALLAKSTLLILFVAWPVMLVILNRSTPNSKLSHCFDSWRHLLVMFAIAVFLLNCGYAFEGSCRRLGEYEFVSEELRSSNGVKTENRFSNTVLGHMPVPVPASYLQGIDLQKREFELGKWSYLRGQQQFRGWWYYYLYAVLVKVPIGTLALWMMAVLVSWYHPGPGFDFSNSIVTLLPAVLLVALVSCETGFSRHVRYILPALPLLFVWSSHIASSRSRLIQSLSVVFCVSSIASSLSVAPHCLSYFNCLSGGPQHGHNHLLDSNIDWGQDLLYLKRWRDEHPHVEPLYVQYFGTTDPAWIGLDCQSIKSNVFRDTMQFNIAPGWYAISVNNLYEYKHWGYELRQYHHFRKFTPVDRAGYSIYIYHITLNDANRVRRELGLPELAEDWEREQEHGPTGGR